MRWEGGFGNVISTYTTVKWYSVNLKVDLD